MTLVESADVFMTNFLPDARAKLGIDVDDIFARNPPASCMPAAPPRA